MRNGAIRSFDNFWRLVWQKPTGSMVCSPFRKAGRGNHNETGERQHSTKGGEFIGTFDGAWLKVVMSEQGDSMWFEVDQDHVDFHVDEKGMGVFTPIEDGAGRSHSLTPSAPNDHRSFWYDNLWRMLRGN